MLRPQRPGRLLLLFILLLLLLLLLLPGGRAASPAPSTAPSAQNGTRPGNGTGPSPASRPGSVLPSGTGLPVLRRAVYVLSALSALAGLYFLLRAFRPRSEGPRNERKTHSRLKKPQRKKYGLLSNYDENIEMASLDSDEDTVFETRNLRR